MEKLDQPAETEANARFLEALSLSEVAFGTRNPEIRKYLAVASATDVRDHMVDVPSAHPALIEWPALMADVATPLRRLPYRFDLGLRETPFAWIDDDGPSIRVDVRFARRVPFDVQDDVRRYYAFVVVLEGISKRVPLIANDEGTPFPSN